MILASQRKLVLIAGCLKSSVRSVVNLCRFVIMIERYYKDTVIEVFDDPTFTTGADNENFYAEFYSTREVRNIRGSFHGIRLYRSGIEVNSCILSASAGTTIHCTSAVLDDDSLLVCCGDSLFSLELPTLKLNWQTRADLAACFQVYKLHDDYLVHGELEISKLSKDGDVIWSFSGADIFVSPDGGDSLLITEDRIELVDWEKNQYILDFNGKVISDSMN